MNPQLEPWQATGESVLCLIEPALFAFTATVCGWNIKQDGESCKCVCMCSGCGRQELLTAWQQQRKKEEEIKIEVAEVLTLHYRQEKTKGCKETLFWDHALVRGDFVSGCKPLGNQQEKEKNPIKEMRKITGKIGRGEESEKTGILRNLIEKNNILDEAMQLSWLYRRCMNCGVQPVGMPVSELSSAGERQERREGASCQLGLQLN